MRSAILVMVMLLAATAAARKYVIQGQNIVGYAGTELKKGLNEIELTMDSLSLFPTLDKVVRFEPADGIVGDDLVFDLDGKRRRYRIVSWDGTNYVLRTDRAFQPPQIGLDWIPCRSRFWMNHVSTNNVRLCNMGMVSDATMRKINPQPKQERREIEIREVNDKGEQRRILFVK